MALCWETKTLNYRGESFTITTHYYQCEDSGERFTTTNSDKDDLGRIYDQYRQRHGIPTAEEIKNIRRKYKVSAAKMSRILGFGANQYRLYETGEMPSLSNARLILLVADEQNFRKLTELL